MSKRRLKPGPYIVPMPTVLVGAVVNGKPNFMTAAFVGIADFTPPTVACGLNASHLTCEGIRENGVFSVNLPGAAQVAAVDWCGLVSGRKEDKARAFEVFYGGLDKAPLIAECPVNAECRLIRAVPQGLDTLFLGEIVDVHADEAVLKDGEPDWAKVSPLIFTFPDKGYWKLGDFVARAWGVGKGFKP